LEAGHDIVDDCWHKVLERQRPPQKARIGEATKTIVICATRLNESVGEKENPIASFKSQFCDAEDGVGEGSHHVTFL
jgi:hypothetical protein